MASNERSEVDLAAEEIKDYAVIPPNGGWGWIVVACAFYCSVIVDGIQLTFGVFLKEISESLNAKYSEVALAGSLMFGTHLLMGPMCAGFSTEFGLRPVTIVGSVICSLGVALAYFATSCWYLYITYGIVGGMGLGLIYMNCLVITGLYFTTLMPIAMGIVVCGTGVGTMVFAALGYFLLTVTDWQTSFLIQSALVVSMGLAALSFKPLKPVKVKFPSKELSVRSKQNKASVFIKKEIPIEVSATRLTLKTVQNMAWEGYLEEAIVTDIKRKRMCQGKCWDRWLFNWCRRKAKREPSVFVLLTELKDMEVSSGRRRSYVERQSLDDESYGLLVPVNSADFSGTSTHRVVFEEIVYDSGKEERKACESLRRTVVNMLDCRLLKSEAFLLFTTSGALQMASLLVVYTFEKDRCYSLGFTEEMSVYFVIFLGGANTLWRLFLGAIAIIPRINYEVIAVIGIVIGGISTMLSGLSENIYYQFGFCVFFGLGMASFAVFRLIILLDLIEPQKVENATGINLMLMGVTCTIFPPLFGWIMEKTQSYDAIFMITGVVIFASAFMLVGLKKIRLKELENLRLK